jgi:CheY-like chemotaxis protein
MAKILVVDDEQDSREMVQQALGEEHEVFTVENWVHIADYIFKHDIDLILMDVNMPGLKGDKLTEILMKQSKTKKPLNIVLFSALDEAELKEKVKEVNAKGYILKTFDKNLLRLRIGRFLRE